MTLIERLQAATGPDRGIDVAILTTVMGYREVSHRLFDRGNDGYWSLEGDEVNPALPAPTGSMDDALKLVPDDWRMDHVGEQLAGGKWDAEIHTRDYSHNKQVSGVGANGALALCIAALKARGIEG